MTERTFLPPELGFSPGVSEVTRKVSLGEEERQILAALPEVQELLVKRPEIGATTEAVLKEAQLVAQNESRGGLLEQKSRELLSLLPMVVREKNTVEQVAKLAQNIALATEGAGFTTFELKVPSGMKLRRRKPVEESVKRPPAWRETAIHLILLGALVVGGAPVVDRLTGGRVRKLASAFESAVSGKPIPSELTELSAVQEQRDKDISFLELSFGRSPENVSQDVWDYCGEVWGVEKSDVVAWLKEHPQASPEQKREFISGLLKGKEPKFLEGFPTWYQEKQKAPGTTPTPTTRIQTKPLPRSATRLYLGGKLRG